MSSAQGPQHPQHLPASEEPCACHIQASSQVYELVLAASSITPVTAKEKGQMLMSLSDGHPLHLPFQTQLLQVYISPELVMLFILFFCDHASFSKAHKNAFRGHEGSLTAQGFLPCFALTRIHVWRLWP